MSAESSSKDASVSVGGTVVAHLKNAKWGFKNSPVTDHDIAGGDPVLHEVGETTYSFSAEYGIVSDAMRTALKATKVTIICYPLGNSAGKPIHTLTDAILSYDASVDRGKPYIASITGSYKSETISTV